jgi:putative transposase
MNEQQTFQRTFVFRAYPTKAQVVALELHLSEACRLYNAALQERRDAWRICHETVVFRTQARQLKEIRAAGDIGIVDAQAANLVLQRVDRAFAAFFRRVKAGEKPGYPRFRSRRRYDSIDFQVNHGAKVVQRGLYVHGIGDIKLKWHRALVGDPKMVILRRDAGRWYANIASDVSAAPISPSTSAVGIDVGLTSFATMSDGSAIENPRHERAAARKVRVARRTVSRRKRGSNRRRKAVQRLQRALGKVKRQRADFHHKASHAIVAAHGLIAVEDLNIKGLARTRLARSVHDAGWGAFIDKLTYKAASAGRTLVKVDPRGTSQVCPCGAPVPKTLADRWHDCPECGLSVSRDHAAAINILGLGLSLQAPKRCMGGARLRSRNVRRVTVRRSSNFEPLPAPPVSQGGE